jgi:hypothetical protein
MELSPKMFDQTRDASSILVLRSESNVGADGSCKRHLLGDAVAVRLVGLEFSRPPREWHDSWRDLLGDRVVDAALVTSSDHSRDLDREGLTVRTVSSPAALTGIGMKTTALMSEWEAAEEEVVFVAESLTEILQYAQLQTLYRFLHVLTGRIDAVGARGQFYLDPTTQPPRVVNTLKTLFHGVLEREADGWRLSVQ